MEACVIEKTRKLPHDDMENSNGPVSLLEIFFDNYNRLKNIATGMGYSASDVEDILQEVSIEAIKTPRRFGTSQTAAAWLTKVTVNRCILEHRRKGRFKRAAEKILQKRSAAPRGRGPLEAAVNLEEMKIVRKTIKKLRPSMLAPIVLRYFCDLNSTEIGSILDVPAATVRSRLRDGRMLMAKSLIDKGIK